jgi:plasmid stability protein
MHRRKFMPTNLQIRNVPDELHRALKVRAAIEGKSMSELLIEQLRATLALPSERELRQQLAGAEPFVMKESSAVLIRRERDAA